MDYFGFKWIVMNLPHIITDNTGLLHTLMAVVALIFGTWVLVIPKGNKLHKKLGYVYTVAMVFVVATSFMMYHLFGGFGIFHFFAVISGLTLIGGMLPMLLKKPKNYISYHYNFMFWSVFGLYGAFLAEILTRIPAVIIKDKALLPIFFNMVGVAVFVVMGLGYYIMFKKKKSWSKFEDSGA